jgi:septin 7
MQLVPILPIVTKADTMTVKEGINYRTELNQRIQYPCLPSRSKPISLFQFSPETLAACGIIEGGLASTAVMRPPFLVVCSNAYNEERLHKEQPELWPERRYMWGTSEAMNPQHSDLLLLRRLLLQEGVEEIARSKIVRCVPELFTHTRVPLAGICCLDVPDSGL